MSRRWSHGNRVQLLENGDEFFPGVCEAIAQAQREVLLETFLLFDDAVGKALHAALTEAARRGVRVQVTVDGYGSPDLSREFTDSLVAAGVRLHVFDPCPKVFGVRLKLFRRMHRKIIVIDAKHAFVGGINFSVEHLASSGPRAKQDYAVEIEGPAVQEIHAFARAVLDHDLTEGTSDVRSRPHRLGWRRSRYTTPAVGEAQVLFLVRDNVAHRADIERHYRAVIRAARREVVIANAYFVPGYRLLREIRNAARHGVQVSLIVQASPDQAIAIRAARTLYGYLARAGVRIYEYDKRAFHGKVALTDDQWATVGSSNLDPLSLALNLEANVFIRDRAFNASLRENLGRVMRDECRAIDVTEAARNASASPVFRLVLFYFLRRFHDWAELMPRHEPRMAIVTPSHRSRQS